MGTWKTWKRALHPLLLLLLVHGGGGQRRPRRQRPTRPQQAAAGGGLNRILQGVELNILDSKFLGLGYVREDLVEELCTRATLQLVREGEQRAQRELSGGGLVAGFTNQVNDKCSQLVGEGEKACNLVLDMVSTRFDNLKDDTVKEADTQCENAQELTVGMVKKGAEAAFNSSAGLGMQLARTEFLRQVEVEKNRGERMFQEEVEKNRGLAEAELRRRVKEGKELGEKEFLEQVRAGHDLDCVVSFHGLLHSRPQHPTKHDDDPRGGYFHRLTPAEFEADTSIVKAPNTYSSRCKVLIENGDLDEHVPQESMEEFGAEMDAAGIDWRVNNHCRTPHGFALDPGMWSTAYHEDADRRSTLSMLSLFAECWPDFPQFPVPVNACGTVLGQSITVQPASRL